VLYEWLRGPRLPSKRVTQEALFPSDSVVVSGSREASLSAELYRSLKRPRGREIDLAIASCAILRDARLWTLTVAAFGDIPRLQLATFGGRQNVRGPSQEWDINRIRYPKLLVE
jgi:predicted nucleic acid-binding protein